jgi:outer membrane immunogenic protein
MAFGRLAVAFGALGISSAAAMAADLTLPPRPYAPYAPAYYQSPVAYEWTGVYIGLSAGGGFGLGGINNNVTSVFCSTSCEADEASSAAVASVPGKFNTAPSGFIGGGQIGYNYQMGGFVWGVEADFSGADISGSDSQTVTATVDTTTLVNTTTATATQKLDWLGTLRARVGAVPFTPLLIYATGGLAYGQVSSQVNFSQTFSAGCACGASPTASASASSIQVGWTAGAGVEWMFAPHWSLKGEFLFYDLGQGSANTIVQVNSAGVPFTTIGINSTANVRGDIARGGINYRF